MKARNILILALVCIISLVESRAELPISVAYYVPFGTHVGVKLATDKTIKTWGDKGDEQKSLSHHLFVSPQVAFFSRIDVNLNYQFNVEAGFQRKRADKKIHHTVLFGLGYLLTSHKVGGSVNLATGEIDKQRVSTNAFLPTLGYSIGRDTQKGNNYYLKAFYGREVLFDAEDAGFFGLELGYRFLLSNSSKTEE